MRLTLVAFWFQMQGYQICYDSVLGHVINTVIYTNWCRTSAKLTKKKKEEEKSFLLFLVNFNSESYSLALFTPTCATP